MCKNIIKTIFVLGLILKSLCQLYAYDSTNFAKPGDTGNIILPIENGSVSVTSVKGVRIEIPNKPSWFRVTGTSLLGPQNIAVGESYSFQVDFEVDSSAQAGNYDVAINVIMDTPNCIPQKWETTHSFSIDTLPQATDQSTGNPIVKDKKYKQDVVITLPAPDETYTDIYGKLDGGGEFRNPDTKTAGEGNHVLIIYYKDKNGNITTRTINFMVDKTAPTVEIAGVEDGGLYNADKTVTVTASDNLDPKPKIEGTISGESSASKTFGEGKHTVTEKAVDWAGNTSETKMVTFTIDKTPPTISLYPSNGSVYYAMKYKFHYYYCQTEKYDEYIEPARI